MVTMKAMMKGLYEKSISPVRLCRTRIRHLHSELATIVRLEYARRAKRVFGVSKCLPKTKYDKENESDN